MRSMRQDFACWNRYYEQLLPLKKAGKIDLPTVPEGCVHNAHMFYIKARDLEQRTRFISYMKENGVLYGIPLYPAAYFSRRTEVRPVPRRGPLYYQRERAPGKDFPCTMG